MKKLLTFLFVLAGLSVAEAQNRNPFGLDDANTARYFSAQQQVGDSTAFMLIADSLEAEGLANNAPLLQLVSADLKAFFFYVRNDYAAVSHLNRAAELAKQQNLMLGYFSYRSNMANFQLGLGKVQEAAQLAEQTLEEAREFDDPRCIIDGLASMANIYDATFNYQLAIQQHMKILEIAEKEGKMVPIDRTLVSELYLASSYYRLRDTENGEIHLQRALAIDPNLMNACYLRANYALSRGNLKEFNRQYQEAQKMGPDFLGTNLHYQALLEVMKTASEGNIGQALEMSRQVMAGEFSEQEQAIAIYRWAGQWDKVAEEQEKLMQRKDSLNTVSNQQQLATMTAEMRTIYETAEKEAQIKEQEFTIILVGILLLASLIIASFVIYRNIEMKKKNRALVNNLNQLLDLRRQEKTRATAMLETENNSEETDVAGEACQSNVQRYIYELLSKNLFCDPEFDRFALLDQLHIQKNGFWKAFEEETGTTAPKYILNLRLEYAAEQIRLHPEYTIEAIAAEAGIPSRTTFYRNFSTRFGISPMLFRDQCNEPLDILDEQTL